MDASLRQIRAFVAVSRVKSFTRAAAALNVSQPALTTQIRRLEETLGVALFDRDTRTVELTRVARDLLPAFERTLQDFDAALASARDIATQERGVVRLAALPSIAAGALPEAILRFRQKRPKVMFDLKDVIAGQVLSLVQAEHVDFGVIGGGVKAADVEIMFRTQDRLHVVYPKGHRIGREKRMTPAALCNYPLILMQRDTSVRAIVDEGFRALNLAPLVTCEAIYMTTAVGMVRAGLGLTILPSSAREIRNEPGLQSKAIDHPAFTRPISIIKRAGRTLPPLSAAFAIELAGGINKAVTR